MYQGTAGIVYWSAESVGDKKGMTFTSHDSQYGLFAI